MGRPLHYKEITDLAIEKNLLSHVGKSPEVTLGARLAALLKNTAKENPLVRVKPGVFALREWDDATIKAGMSDKAAAKAAAAARESPATTDEEAPAEKAPEDRPSPSPASGDEEGGDWGDED
ncbi:MAG: winged helix-turn-helix domain-containing protein, partial [Polyangiaceae bacterium]